MANWRKERIGQSDRTKNNLEVVIQLILSFHSTKIPLNDISLISTFLQTKLYNLISEHPSTLSNLYIQIIWPKKMLPILD